MGHTGLQLPDRQYVARLHLFHNAAYHLQYIYVDYQPIATEGGRYVQESHSIQFCRPEWKNIKQQGFHVWPANTLSGCSKQAAHISPILCRLRNSSPKTSLWTTESSIDFIHNRRVLANAFMSRCYKTAYLIRGILFYNLLTFNILQNPKDDSVCSTPYLENDYAESHKSVRPMRAERFFAERARPYAMMRQDFTQNVNVPLIWRLVADWTFDAAPESLPLPKQSSNMVFPV